MCLTSASCNTMFPNFGACFRNAGRAMNTECRNNLVASSVPFPLHPFDSGKDMFMVYLFYLLISFPLFYEGYTKVCIFLFFFFEKKYIQHTQVKEYLLSLEKKKFCVKSLPIYLVAIISCRNCHHLESQGRRKERELSS